jgi:heme O synthase-like polyprenyltransferase
VGTAAGPVATATATVVDVATTVDAAAATDEPAGRGVTEGACAGLIQPSVNPAPMRLFHLSIGYLTLLFAVIAVTALLPWGTW